MRKALAPGTRRTLRGAVVGALLLAGAPRALAVSPEDKALTALSPPEARCSSTTPAAPAGWLSYLNSYRAAACLPPVTENPVLSRGDRRHALYMAKNEALLHGEDPGNPWYSPEGEAAARQSTLFSSTCDGDCDDQGDTDRFVIDTWMQSPFHAVGVLDPRLAQVGFGVCRDGDGTRETSAALNVTAGIDHRAAATYPVFWPGNGAAVPIGSHWGGSPNPLASCPGYPVPSGLPLVVQIGPGNLIPAVTATALTRNGQPLEHCVFDETTYANPDRDEQQLGRSILAARNAVVIVPRLPLTPAATYTAALTVNGRRYGWTFGISAPAAAGDQRTFSGFVRYEE